MTTSKVDAGLFEWTRPVPPEQWDPFDERLLEAAKAYEQVEQLTGYTFRDKGFLLMAFSHGSLPDSLRVVPGCMHPMDTLGDALLKYLLAAKLYGCIHPLCPRSLHEARSRVEDNYSLGLVVTRHGWHQLLRSGSAALNDEIVNYVRSIQSGDYPGDRTKVPPKALADCFEALCGAVYLDSNLNLATSWHFVYPLLQTHIDHEIAAVAASPSARAALIPCTFVLDHPTPDVPPTGVPGSSAADILASDAAETTHGATTHGATTDAAAAAAAPPGAAAPVPTALNTPARDALATDDPVIDAPAPDASAALLFPAFLLKAPVLLTLPVPPTWPCLLPTAPLRPPTRQLEALMLLILELPAPSVPGQKLPEPSLRPPRLQSTMHWPRTLATTSERNAQTP
ncbi:hypothetical protein HPB50_007577 [Hyalomma asiaticum]|uniref:Uncharacterized protein n=1 Tax=Hyalomma asiaticum TaxID=266040 RepID=A0ACB7S0Z7_HYAAI|nr:hypothetical protein HPB50_007577 [Hyalomma asiaticum]